MGCGASAVETAPDAVIDKMTFEMRAHKCKRSKLDLRGLDYGTEQFAILCAALRPIRRVRELHAGADFETGRGTQLTAEAAMSLADTLRCNSRLRTLGLVSNQIGAAGVAVLAQALLHNKGVRHLGLSYNDVEDRGAKSLATALRVNRSLRELLLARNGIGNLGARAFATVLESNQSIQLLDLSKNLISDEGALALGGALLVNTSLSELRLSHNPIGAPGAAALANAVEVSTSLQTLKIDGLNVEGADHRYLADALKHSLARRTHIAVEADMEALIRRVLEMDENLLWVNLRHRGYLLRDFHRLAITLQDNNVVKAFHAGASSSEPGVRLGDEDAWYVAGVVRANATLRTLHLSNNKFRADGIAAIATALKDNTALRELNLSSNYAGVAGTLALAEALLVNGTVQTLELSSNCIGMHGAASLSSALRINSSLVSLNLADNDIGCDGMEAISESLGGNRFIRKLWLSYNRIGRRGLTALAAALERNATIEFLDLNHNCFGSRAGGPLAGALGANSTLETLQLADCQLGQPGISAVARGLRSNRSVTYLDLSYNDGRDMGAAAVAGALDSAPALQTVLLAANGIEDPGATAIADALRSNSTLTALSLNRNAISPAGMAALAAALSANGCLRELRLRHMELGAEAASGLVDALQHNTALQTIDITDDEPYVGAVVEALAMNKGLRALAAEGSHLDLPSLVGRARRNDETLAAIDLAQVPSGSLSALCNSLIANTVVTSLTVARSDLSYGDCVSLSTLVRSNRRLRVLQLPSSNLGQDNGHVVLRALRRNGSLRTLALPSTGLRARAVEHLWQAPAKAKLRSVDLSNNRAVSGHTAASLLRSQRSTLQHLRLHGTAIDASDVHHLTDALRADYSLESLDLGGYSFSTAALAAVCQALCSHPTLERFGVRRTVLHSAGIVALERLLQASSSLTALTLSGSRVDGGCGRLVRLIAESPSLAALQMNDMEMGDAGILAIAAAVASNATLVRLGLGGNGITDDAADPLLTLVNSRAGLALLDLRDNFLGDGLQDRLRSAQAERTPDCELLLGRPSSYLAVLTEQVVARDPFLATVDLQATGAASSWHTLGEFKALMAALESTPVVQRLALGPWPGGDGAQDQPDAVSAVAAVLGASNSVCHLEVRGWTLGRQAEVLARACATPGSSIASLQLLDVPLTPSEASRLAHALCSSTALAHLRLQHNDLDSAAGAASLAQLLELTSSLQRLEVSQNLLGAEGGSSLATALQLNRTLTWLSVDHGGLGDGGARAIAEALQRNTSLLHLRLSDNGISDHGLLRLLEGILAQSQLQSLDLSQNSIAEQGAQSAAEVLQRAPHLQAIDFSGNRSIGPDGVASLAWSLCSNRSLQRLSLSQTAMGDEGAIALGLALQINRTLVEVNAVDASVGPVGQQALAGALEANTTLQTLTCHRPLGQSSPAFVDVLLQRRMSRQDGPARLGSLPPGVELALESRQDLTDPPRWAASLASPHHNAVLNADKPVLQQLSLRDRARDAQRAETELSPFRANPMHWAAHLGSRSEAHLDCLRLLLEQPNARAMLEGRDGVSGMTPLHWAARAASAGGVTALLSQGADPEATDLLGRNYWAIDSQTKWWAAYKGGWTPELLGVALEAWGRWQDSQPAMALRWAASAGPLALRDLVTGFATTEDGCAAPREAAMLLTRLGQRRDERTSLAAATRYVSSVVSVMLPSRVEATVASGYTLVQMLDAAVEDLRITKIQLRARGGESEWGLSINSQEGEYVLSSLSHAVRGCVLNRAGLLATYQRQRKEHLAQQARLRRGAGRRGIPQPQQRPAPASAPAAAASNIPQEPDWITAARARLCPPVRKLVVELAGCGVDDGVFAALEAGLRAAGSMLKAQYDLRPDEVDQAIRGSIFISIRDNVIRRFPSSLHRWMSVDGESVFGSLRQLLDQRVPRQIPSPSAIPDDQLMAYWARSTMRAVLPQHMRLLLAGSGGNGKTQLLNALSLYLPSIELLAEDSKQAKRLQQEKEDKKKKQQRSGKAGAQGTAGEAEEEEEEEDEGAAAAEASATASLLPRVTGVLLTPEQVEQRLSKEAKKEGASADDGDAEDELAEHAAANLSFQTRPVAIGCVPPESLREGLRRYRPRVQLPPEQVLQCLVVDVAGQDTMLALRRVLRTARFGVILCVRVCSMAERRWQPGDTAPPAPPSQAELHQQAQWVRQLHHATATLGDVPPPPILLVGTHIDRVWHGGARPKVDSDAQLLESERRMQVIIDGIEAVRRRLGAELQGQGLDGLHDQTGQRVRVPAISHVVLLRSLSLRQARGKQADARWERRKNQPKFVPLHRLEPLDNHLLPCEAFQRPRPAGAGDGEAARDRRFQWHTCEPDARGRRQPSKLLQRVALQAGALLEAFARGSVFAAGQPGGPASKPLPLLDCAVPRSFVEFARRLSQQAVSFEAGSRVPAGMFLQRDWEAGCVSRAKFAALAASCFGPGASSDERVMDLLLYLESLGLVVLAKQSAADEKASVIFLRPSLVRMAISCVVRQRYLAQDMVGQPVCMMTTRVTRELDGQRISARKAWESATQAGGAVPVTDALEFPLLPLERDAAAANRRLTAAEQDDVARCQAERRNLVRLVSEGLLPVSQLSAWWSRVHPDVRGGPTLAEAAANADHDPRHYVLQPAPSAAEGGNEGPPADAMGEMMIAALGGVQSSAAIPSLGRDAVRRGLLWLLESYGVALLLPAPATSPARPAPLLDTMDLLVPGVTPSYPRGCELLDGWQPNLLLQPPDGAPSADRLLARVAPTFREQLARSAAAAMEGDAGRTEPIVCLPAPPGQVVPSRSLPPLFGAPVRLRARLFGGLPSDLVQTLQIRLAKRLAGSQARWEVRHLSMLVQQTVRVMAAVGDGAHGPTEPATVCGFVDAHVCLALVARHTARDTTEAVRALGGLAGAGSILGEEEDEEEVATVVSAATADVSVVASSANAPARSLAKAPLDCLDLVAWCTVPALGESLAVAPAGGGDDRSLRRAIAVAASQQVQQWASLIDTAVMEVEDAVRGHPGATLEWQVPLVAQEHIPGVDPGMARRSQLAPVKAIRQLQQPAGAPNSAQWDPVKAVLLAAELPSPPAAAGAGGSAAGAAAGSANGGVRRKAELVPLLPLHTAVQVCTQARSRLAQEPFTCTVALVDRYGSPAEQLRAGATGGPLELVPASTDLDEAVSTAAAANGGAPPEATVLVELAALRRRLPGCACTPAAVSSLQAAESRRQSASEAIVSEPMSGQQGLLTDGRVWYRGAGTNDWLSRCLDRLRRGRVAIAGAPLVRISAATSFHQPAADAVLPWLERRQAMEPGSEPKDLLLLRLPGVQLPPAQLSALRGVHAGAQAAQQQQQTDLVALARSLLGGQEALGSGRAAEEKRLLELEGRWQAPASTAPGAGPVRGRLSQVAGFMALFLVMDCARLRIAGQEWLAGRIRACEDLLPLVARTLPRAGGGAATGLHAAAAGATSREYRQQLGSDQLLSWLTGHLVSGRKRLLQGTPGWAEALLNLHHRVASRHWSSEVHRLCRRIALKHWRGIRAIVGSLAGVEAATQRAVFAADGSEPPAQDVKARAAYTAVLGEAQAVVAELWRCVRGFNRQARTAAVATGELTVALDSGLDSEAGALQPARHLCVGTGRGPLALAGLMLSRRLLASIAGAYSDRVAMATTPAASLGGGEQEGKACDDEEDGAEAGAAASSFPGVSPAALSITVAPSPLEAGGLAPVTWSALVEQDPEALVSDAEEVAGPGQAGGEEDLLDRHGGGGDGAVADGDDQDGGGEGARPRGSVHVSAPGGLAHGSPDRLRTRELLRLIDARL